MKKLLVIMIAALMLFNMAACGGQEVESEQIVNKDEGQTQQTTTPTPSPTPEPTLSPAEVFAQEKGVAMPDINEEIITDIEEIKNILIQQPYWSGTADDTDIMWYKEDGRYISLTSIPLMEGMPDVYGTGKWYFEGEKLVLESIDAGLTDMMIEDMEEIEGLEDEEMEEVTEYLADPAFSSILVAADIGGTIHLYLCDEETFFEYVPATEQEKLLVSTDPEEIANIRYFLCSATWLLVGHYDEAGNYSHRPNSRAYTFLADGQLVVKEDGESVPGYYTLNYGEGGFIDLTYLLEDGRAMYTPLWADNSSSYASSIFLYPDFMSNASDVYMAKSKYNVSDYVTEGEPIPKYEPLPVSWSVRIGDITLSNDEIEVEAPIRVVDGQACVGYMIDSLVEFTGQSIGDSVEVVFADGQTLSVNDPSQALLTFHIEGVNLEAPVLVLVEENEISDSAVAEIRVN